MNKYSVIVIIAFVLLVQGYVRGTSYATMHRAVDIPVPQRLNIATQNSQAVPWGVNESNLAGIPEVTTKNVAQIAMGAHHALALMNDGRVVGWGINVRGELTMPQNLSNIVSVSVGITHSVALRSNGSVAMWGSAASLVLSPTVTLPTDVVQIAAGNRHTVLLRQNGSVVVAGGLASQRAVPAGVSSQTVVAVAAGNDTSLALTNQGEVFAWGNNLTIPDGAKTNVIRIFAQDNIYAALRNDGNLQIWGDVTTVTPDASSSMISSATNGCPCLLMPNASAIRSVEAAIWGVAVVRRTGQVVTMERAGYSVPVGIPDRVMTLGMFPSHAAGVALRRIDATAVVNTTPTRAPLAIQPPAQFNPPGMVSVWGGSNLIRTVPISATTSIVQVVAGVGHIVALRNDGRIVAWGNNDLGQINVPTDLTVVRDITSPLRIVMLAAGANHTLALRANGTVVAWGDNRANQTTGVASWSNVVQIAAGARHSIALSNTGALVGTGNNSYNQLNFPQLRSVVKITAAGNHSVALLRNGSMVAWGRNQYGQASIPTAMRGVDVWAMPDNTVILQPNGQVVVLGSRLFDQADVPGELFQRIGVGNYHVLAITKSGDLRIWGLNEDNQTEVPNNVVSPYLVTGGEDFSVALSVGVSTQVTNTATPSPIPPTWYPSLPTSAPLPTYDGVTVWALGDIPAVNDTDISSLTITSDTIGIVHSDNTVTLNQSTSIVPRTLPSNAQTNVQQLGLGDAFGVVLKRDYSLYVWGSAVPAVPSKFMTNVAEISVNRNHLMLRAVDGTVWSNLFAISSQTTAKHIAAGPTFATVLWSNGTVSVWANDNSEGLLSLPSFSNDVAEIAAGQYHVLALQTDGKLVAWGAEQHDAGQVDIPASALHNIVAIAASDRISVALRADAMVAAWGDLPANTASQLATIATNQNAVAIATGKGRIAVLTSGAGLTAGTPTRTLMPTATALVYPTTTARVVNNQLLANMVGWFPIENVVSRLEYAGLTARYPCANPYECPDSDPNAMVNRGAYFHPTRIDEVTGNVPMALGNKSFTATFWMRRDGRDTEDVAFSVGALARVRQYLTMGVDQENRAYCSFFGDDLRSAIWYEDLNWHHYACTFNQTTRVRQLYRDGQLVAQDLVLSAVSFPASPIIFGERYDSMAGLAGSLDEFALYDRVLSTAELQAYTQLPLQNRLEAVSFDDLTFPSISPNRSALLCVPTIPCPGSQRDTHNVAALVLTGNEQLQFSDSVARFANGLTVSYWAKRATNDSTIEVVASQGNSPNLFVMGIYADQEAFCQLGSDLLKSMRVIDNEWHHYACTYNRRTKTLKFYVDGVIVDSKATVDYAGLGTLYIGRLAQSMSNVRGINGLVDDIFLYAVEIPETTIGLIYNTTNPPAPIATVVIPPNLSRSPTFTAVRAPTNTPLRRPSKTRLPVSATVAIFINNTNTAVSTLTQTPSASRTVSPTRTATASRTASGTIETATATVTVTPTITLTRSVTMTNVTRTPLIMTRTMLARLSPTWGAQTLTATYIRQAATNVAATATRAAAVSATNIASTSIAATMTAYPEPPTLTSSPTAYPTP